MALGILARHILPAVTNFKRGVDVTIRTILPIGIVLLGIRLDFYDLVRVGGRALLVAVMTIATVIVVSHLISRLMGVNERLGLLVGVGTAICGTSAILVTAPVVEASEDDVAFSVATINLFGVVSMIVFPILAVLFRINGELFGIWCGLSIHATPQVIAAGFAHYSEGQLAGEVATIVKLMRVSLLGPVVFCLGTFYALQRHKREVVLREQKINWLQLIPPFVIFFIGMALLRTLGFLPEVTFHMSERFIFGQGDYSFDLVRFGGETSKWLIAGALTAVGLNTDLKAMRIVGFKPFLLGLLATLVITAVGLLLATLSMGLG